MTASVDDIHSVLTNIARQLGLGNANAIQPTTTASPKFTAVNLSTTAVLAIGTSAIRHGLVMHNPGTANCYVYTSNMTPAPTTTSLAGTVVIYPGGTLSFPVSEMPNVNNGFSAFTNTGTAQPFTVIEFF